MAGEPAIQVHKDRSCKPPYHREHSAARQMMSPICGDRLGHVPLIPQILHGFWRGGESPRAATRVSPMTLLIRMVTQGMSKEG